MIKNIHEFITYPSLTVSLPLFPFLQSAVLLIQNDIHICVCTMYSIVISSDFNQFFEELSTYKIHGNLWLSLNKGRLKLPPPLKASVLQIPPRAIEIDSKWCHFHPKHPVKDYFTVIAESNG